MELVSKGPKKRRRFPVGLGLPLAALVLWVSLAMAFARPGEAELYPARGTPVTVHIISNGFHTDLALPMDRVLARGGPLAAAADAATDDPWVAVGWGDERFYTETGLSFARAMDGVRALFASGNPSVVQMFGVSRDPGQAYKPGVARPVALSEAGFAAMLARMEQSLVLENGIPARGPASYDPDLVVFKSNETFSALRLCNRWTSDMLDAAGLPTVPWLDGIAPLFLFNLSWRADITPAA